MTEKQRIALIKLCDGHVFPDKEIKESLHPKFVTCTKCPLQWGEVELLLRQSEECVDKK